MNSINACTHTKDDGSPCEAFPLQGKTYCYFHRKYYEATSLPGEPSYRPPLLETHHSILLASTQLYQAFLSGKFDRRDAMFSLQILRLASKSICAIEKAAAQSEKQKHQQVDSRRKENGMENMMDAGRPRPANSPSDEESNDDAELAPPRILTAQELIDAPNLTVSDLYHSIKSLVRKDSDTPAPAQPEPQPQPEPTRGVYDPEGCLSFLTKDDK